MKRLLRALRPRLVPPTVRLLARLFGPLPPAAVQRIGRLFGRLAWALGGRDRRRTLDHLAIAFPDLPEAERLRLARASFTHHGTTLAECLHLLRCAPAALDRWVEVEGWEQVEVLRRAGRPIVILTGHCGNWELLAATINRRGLEMAVVARAADEAELNELVLALRRRWGTETIERGGGAAARRLLKVLRAGGALGMLIDQDTAKVEGVWVPFFGRPAFTPVGAARIALKQDAAVVPAFIERRPDGHHHARFDPPLDLPPDETEATAVMTAAIEAQVRRRPEQWVWMHRRWRRQAPDSSAAGRLS